MLCQLSQLDSIGIKVVTICTKQGGEAWNRRGTLPEFVLPSPEDPEVDIANICALSLLF